MYSLYFHTIYFYFSKYISIEYYNTYIIVMYITYTTGVYRVKNGMITDLLMEEWKKKRIKFYEATNLIRENKNDYSRRELVFTC